jgi:hypothetical protein
MHTTTDTTHVDAPNSARQFTLDGEPVGDTFDFVVDNDFGLDELAQIFSLTPGESMNLGGGAFALRRLTRVR